MQYRKYNLIFLHTTMRNTTTAIKKITKNTPFIQQNYVFNSILRLKY